MTIQNTALLINKTKYTYQARYSKQVSAGPTTRVRDGRSLIGQFLTELQWRHLPECDSDKISQSLHTHLAGSSLDYPAEIIKNRVIKIIVNFKLHIFLSVLFTAPSRQ